MIQNFLASLNSPPGLKLPLHRTSNFGDEVVDCSEGRNVIHLSTKVVAKVLQDQSGFDPFPCFRHSLDPFSDIPLLCFSRSFGVDVEEIQAVEAV
jgi:hypothetical protein